MREMFIITIDKKEQKRIAHHEKNIESSKQKIWKYEQKLEKSNLDDVKISKIQNKINQELHIIQTEEAKIENPNLSVQAD